MSKQSDAKAIQNYREKPFVKMCGNCKRFAFDSILSYRAFDGREFFDEKNLRCAGGGFKVKKTAVCDDWKAKE